MTDHKAFEPRPWQREAEEQYFAALDRRFLLEACPGAGKTAWALWAAARMLRERRVERVVIVAPLRTVIKQWAKTASQVFGVRIDASWRAREEHAESWNVSGIAVSYNAVFLKSATYAEHCNLRDTLVILDEIHHAAERQGWGDALHYAFDRAAYILSLSGTPFRHEGTIPFVRYVVDPESGMEISNPHYRWTYKQERRTAMPAVRDIEPVLLDGEISLEDKATGVQTVYTVSQPLDQPALVSARMLEALNPERPYFRKLLAQAQSELNLHRAIDPHRRGLIIAYSIRHARAIGKALREMECTYAIAAGTRNAIERRESTRVLEQFQDDDRNLAPDWLIAVRMASEGYDCPRLAVLVYATNQLTEWAVIQAIGRVIRGDGQATVIGPAEPRLRRLMDQIFQGELIVKHVPIAVDEEDEPSPGSTGDDPRTSPYVGKGAEPGEFVRLIEGGEFTLADERLLRQTAEAHGVRHASVSDLAHLYCDWGGIDTGRRDLEALNARPDARLAVVASAMVVRRRVNLKVETFVDRTGRTFGSVNGEIARRWAPRAKSTLPQLWEIEQWLDGRLS